MSVKTINYKEIREVSLEVVSLYNKLMSLGLYKTASIMHEVVKQIGWEVSEVIEGKHVTRLPTNASQEIYE